jgi:hypothetical protein
MLIGSATLLIKGTICNEIIVEKEIENNREKKRIIIERCDSS